MAPFTDHAAWKLHPSDTRQLLTINVDRLHPSSRASSYISSIMQERFTSPYHHWCEVPPDVHDMFWGEFQKRCVWDLILSMIKTMHAWEVKVDDHMRDFLGDALAAIKRPGCIPEMFWEQMMKR
ncbi:hypothetical protein M9H77_22900 [Catharanthus roseus]|uniref:Uncharacterized protein n=1 Tax=Catharanthus roseus TaxID=4058 RepID=A0ACC0AT08_CATRO|nr:hypothetical protein M9H77_22900 [Catharanthus roseus]